MIRFFFLIFSAGIILVSPHSGGMAAEEKKSFPDLVQRITPAVVAIATFSPLRNPRVLIRGTGFVVHDGRHVITNAHVVPKERDLEHK